VTGAVGIGKRQSGTGGVNPLERLMIVRTRRLSASWRALMPRWMVARIQAKCFLMVRDDVTKGSSPILDGAAGNEEGRLAPRRCHRLVSAVGTAGCPVSLPESPEAAGVSGSRRREQHTGSASAAPPRGVTEP